MYSTYTQIVYYIEIVGDIDNVGFRIVGLSLGHLYVIVYSTYTQIECYIEIVGDIDNVGF